MKVLLINNCHYKRGGAETVYFETANMLIRAGHEVVFFSIEDKKNIITGQKEYFVSKGNLLKRLIGYFNNREAARQLDLIIRKEKPDIAHAHLLWGGITASIINVLHGYGIPIVHTAHDYRMVCPAYTFRNGRGEVCEKCKGGHYIQCVKNKCAKGSFWLSAIMALEVFYRNKKWHPAKELDGIIYVSSFAQKKHSEFDSRFRTIKNTVLYNITTIAEKYPPIMKNGGYFLYYGRLSYEKGVGTLIGAFSKHPELNLKVVGTGPEEDVLKQKCFDNIEFVGYKSGEDLYNLVRNARFVCVPSEWYENNPMTIVESYSMGVPVIGARIGGIPEIIIDGVTGFLFDSGSVGSLESVINRSLCIDSDLYEKLKVNSLAFAKDNFNCSKYPEKLVAFYKNIINKQ